MEKLAEQTKQEIKGFIAEISNITEQQKEQYIDFNKQHKEQLKEMFAQNRQQNKELLATFYQQNDKQIKEFLKQFLKNAKQENTELLGQILKEMDHSVSGFIEHFSQIMDIKNSAWINQNTQLIKQIEEQTAQNHGTINKRFEELTIYQVLATFRENLITIKTNLVILEKLDIRKINLLHELYLRYQRGHSNVPVLDITRGMITMKILLPPFFTRMLKNLSILKSQLDNKVYTEMTHAINDYNLFFKNINKKPEKLDEMKKLLDSNIVTVDEILAKLVIF